MGRIPLRGPPNETWADIKQLAWAFLMVAPFVALAAWGARVLIGPRAAWWLGIGLLAFAFIIIALIVGLSLAVSFGAEFGARWLAAFRQRARRRGAG